MRQLSDLHLSDNQSEALERLRRELFAKFDVEALFIFGSVARGEADEESDIDLLALIRKPVNRMRRHRITDLVFEINLEFGTNFSSLVIDVASWEQGPISVLPIHDEIIRDGIAV